MLRFTQLFTDMDRTKRTSEKLSAMGRYFAATPPEDAAWALFFLSGRKLKRLVPSNILHSAITEVTGLPEWLIGESYEAVGDFAETLALLFPQHETSGFSPLALHSLVEERMLRLRSIADPAQQQALIVQTWRELDASQRLVFNKLITGNFRVGVAETLIVRALAGVAGVSAAVMAHRFTGGWEPTAEAFLQLLRGADESATENEAAQPYPFYLAYPLEQPPESLGEVNDWQIEWKYDGLRAQLIRRESSILIWSRGDELIGPAFPEIVQSASDLPVDTVLDGEIVGWENDHPLPFTLLQRRINRKRVEAALWTDVPVAFVAFDLLEQGGVDLRAQPLSERRGRLEELLKPLQAQSPIRLAPLVRIHTWDDLTEHRQSSRAQSVEGVMLKRRSSGYGVGRRRGDWWKWKIEPYTVDAVLIYAQGGSGRRSGLFTDYTFGVWDRSPGDDPDSGSGAPRELVPVAKAYSGLTDQEIREVDRFIKRNTISRHGPVRVVKPELVFELAFEGIQESGRHKAQLALRFPRMNRWRIDKKAEEADTLQTLQAMLKQAQAFHGSERLSQ